MKTTVQPTPVHTEQIINRGQQINRHLVSELAENSDQAMLDWLRSINAPEQVCDLYNCVSMLLMTEQQLLDGKELSASDGANALEAIITASNALEAVGGRIGNFKLEGTLPRYTLQAVDPEKVPE